MTKRKVIMLLSGYTKDYKLWDTKGSKIRRMLEQYNNSEYEVIYEFDDYLYMHPTNGFEHFASRLSSEVEEQAFDKKIIPICKCCNRPMEDKAYIRKGADEIILIGHSMGGVTARLYLKDDSIGSQVAKEKVKHVITLASPHHGTTVEFMEWFSFFSLAVAPLPFLDELFEDGIASAGKCYRQIQPGSQFLQKLNATSDVSPNAKYYSIWGKGDLISTPIQTAVLTGAYNYFHDNFKVRHEAILRWSTTMEIIEGILDAANGKGSIPDVTGLQKYPTYDEHGDCTNSNGHSWIPLWPRDDIQVVDVEIPHISPYEKEHDWKCQNEMEGNKCDANARQLWSPQILGCKVGKLDTSWRWHEWKKLERVWKCQKCDQTFTGTQRPSSFGKCKGVFSMNHRWRVENTIWQCEKCNITAKESWLTQPPKIGCTVGIIENKLHDWGKVSEIHNFRFKCLFCDKEIWHAGKDTAK